MAKRRTSQGPRGQRGARGARGMTGPMGRRGEIGRPGHKGLKGQTGPLHQDKVLDMVMTHFDDVYQQLSIQTKRLAQLQAQVDRLDAERLAKK